MDFLINVEAWHPLPGAPLPFRLRFVAALRIRLGTGSRWSAAAFCDLHWIQGKAAGKGGEAVFDRAVCGINEDSITRPVVVFSIHNGLPIRRLQAVNI